ncbi:MULTISPECIES: hypothetical protein [Bacillus cereus group]|uniref:hypothetical protein n=1 Tax=Bacillus cereus group TaxID=86661 RepID=UPI0008640F42|nr:MULTISPECIES: hypothetical protein [Bacillus cereus group]AWC29276.1 hypothetical protein CG483_013705 [Bacillus cytotoxicus]AWC41402.1 hypothetical protein CG480_013705 [Bacillus cytotoxicus]AWC49333.1 hypothetical protein CG478_013705 [Bacillus cytotoxicus]AWC53348.1 hypothetical protein CG477_013665 [Bacillus cytotoxicus]AWC57475.1 hypothetical protein CG476_013690 [Bacillus cytotoxicus]
MRDQLEKLIEELKLSQSLLGSRSLNLLDDGDLEKYGYYNGQRVVCERMQKKLEQILEGEENE